MQKVSHTFNYKGKACEVELLYWARQEVLRVAYGDKVISDSNRIAQYITKPSKGALVNEAKREINIYLEDK